VTNDDHGRRRTNALTSGAFRGWAGSAACLTNRLTLGGPGFTTAGADEVAAQAAGRPGTPREVGQGAGGVGSGDPTTTWLVGPFPEGGSTDRDGVRGPAGKPLTAARSASGAHEAIADDMSAWICACESALL
jgi:hypothetical protein